MQAEVRRHVVRTSDLYPSRPSSIYLGPGPHGPHPPPLVVPAGRQAGVGRNTTAGRTEHRIQCCRPATFMPMATTVPPPRTRTASVSKYGLSAACSCTHAHSSAGSARPCLCLLPFLHGSNDPPPEPAEQQGTNGFRWQAPCALRGYSDPPARAL
jgi:hypothetical protein